MTGLKKCGKCDNRVARMYYNITTGGAVFVCIKCAPNGSKTLPKIGRVPKFLGGEG